MKNQNQIPFLSVILPCYNVDKYIKKALLSVTNQTLKNIEIICINDGSSDKTLDIINEFAQNDNRIKVYTQENQGQGVARNNGINYATAPYIAFMDPDDWVAYDMYEKLYNLAVQNDVDFVECGFIKYYETSGELKKVKFDYPACENKIFNYTLLLTIPMFLIIYYIYKINRNRKIQQKERKNKKELEMIYIFQKENCQKTKFLL